MTPDTGVEVSHLCVHMASSRRAGGMLFGRQGLLGRKRSQCLGSGLCLHPAPRGTGAWERNAVSSGSQASSPRGEGEGALREAEGGGFGDAVPSPGDRDARKG